MHREIKEETTLDADILLFDYKAIFRQYFSELDSDSYPLLFFQFCSLNRLDISFSFRFVLQNFQ